MEFEKNIRDHRLVRAGTMKDEQLINFRHCIHSKPIPGLDFANGCSDADLHSTGSEILLACREQRDRNAGEGLEEHKPQRSGPL